MIRTDRQAPEKSVLNLRVHQIIRNQKLTNSLTVLPALWIRTIDDEPQPSQGEGEGEGFSEESRLEVISRFKLP